MPSSIFTKFIPTSSLNRNSKLTGKKSYFFIRVLLWSERSSMKWKNSWLYQFKLWHTLKLLMNTFCRSLSPFLIRNAKNRVRDFISDHFGVSQLHLSHPTFFSRLDSKVASTVHDEYWHLHIDKETYPNFHYTSLLYLTDHGVDFNGGEFVFVDSHDKLNR